MGSSRARPLLFLFLLLLALAALGSAALACGALIVLPPAEGAEADGDASAEAAASDGAPPEAPRIDADPDPPADLCAAKPSPCVKLWEPSGGVEYPFGIAATAAHVYWVAQASGTGDSPYDGIGEATVRRVLKVGGGGVAELIATGQRRGQLLAISGDRVFWSTKLPGGQSSERLAIHSAGPLQSCPPNCEELWWFRERDANVTHLAAPTPSSPKDSPLLVATSDEHQTFVLRALASPSLDPVPGAGGHGAAANQDGVYVLRGSVVARIPSTGVASLFGNLDEGARAFGGGPRTLWALLDTGELVSAPTDGTGAPNLRFKPSAAWSVPWGTGPKGPEDWRELVADDTYIYLGAQNGRGILRIDIVTGVLNYVKKNESAWYLAVDDDGLYWGSHGNDGSAGAIWMMKKRP